MKIPLGNYQIDILVSGFPGRSLYHGGMGWSTIALICGRDHVEKIGLLSPCGSLLAFAKEMRRKSG